MSDPFDPASPGRHITDQGARYAITDQDPANFDFIQREFDVIGQFFISPGPLAGRAGWPSILVELNLQSRVLTNSLDELADDDVELRWGEDLLPAALAARGLARVRSWRVPPEVDQVRWTVRLRGTERRPSGVYGPGVGGTPSGWVLMSPRPAHLPELWPALLNHTGRQCAVYVTTNSQGLTLTKDAEQWQRLVDEQAAAGTLFGTRAAVLS